MTVVVQASGVAELRKVLCGRRGGRMVSEGDDTIFVYLGCKFAALYSTRA